MNQDVAIMQQESGFRVHVPYIIILLFYKKIFLKKKNAGTLEHCSKPLISLNKVLRTC